MMYALDLFGVAVFAISGAMAARQLQMDPFGALILAGVTAIGGGTLRDLLLDITPFWIADPNYLYVIAATAIFTVIWPLKRGWPYRILNVADAFGLALFTVMGMSRALSAEVSMTVAIVMGVMTGVAGGMIRDVLSGQVPLILRREVYATASLVGALVLAALLHGNMDIKMASAIAMLTTLLIRLTAIRWKLALPTLNQHR
ncbi:trimeric intracellular cation channel family protein [Neiella marina]|uniref:Trimeric intracellular cation channel family protein n=1 Tax=Neiella holothuriorum TaxID=2870530 RepID=A0ABS7EFJ0_9GAMM|nr:trimeric intracellular cation channel family protein [Neiella holothuriorum]MBW8191117.1 trimeric intracellular cation channel family protein [Neiella holothuriorum]